MGQIFLLKGSDFQAQQKYKNQINDIYKKNILNLEMWQTEP